MHKRDGFATTEYLVIVAALLLALITPVSNGKNAIELLMDALKSLYSGWIYVMSAAVFA